MIKFIYANIHLKEVFQHGIITFIVRIFGILLQLIFGIFIARVYGAEGFGIYSITVAFTMLLGALGKFGIDQTFLKLVSIYNEHGEYSSLKTILHKGLLIATLISTGIMILLCLLAPILVTDLLHNHKLLIPIYIVAFGLPFFSILTIMISFLRALKFITLAIILQTVVIPLINIIICFVLFTIIKNSVNYIIIINLISMIISLAVAMWFAYAFFIAKLKSVIYNVDYDIHAFWRINIAMFGISILIICFGNIDIIMLEIFRSTHEVGIYSAALKLLAPLNMIATSINMVIAPKFAILYKNKDFANIKKVLLASSAVSFFTASPIVLVFIFFAEPIMTLYHSDFAIGWPVLLILLIGQVIYLICGNIASLLTMAGQEKLMNLILFCSIVFLIIFNLLFIPFYGMIGAAIAMSLSFTIYSILTIIIAYIHIYKKSDIV